MDLQNEKCVMVIDEHLPLGIIANTAAIMGITLGKKTPSVITSWRCFLYRLSLSKDFFLCLRADRTYEAPSTAGIMCRAAKNH